MIGLRTGLKAGARSGLAVGVGADPMAAAGGYEVTWDLDGPGDGFGVPSDATQWADVVSAAAFPGSPASAWLFQSAGAPADVIGSNNLTAFSTPAYQQAFVSGWAGVCVHFNSTADSLYNTSVVNTGTTSALLLAYVALTGDPGSPQFALNIGNGASQADRRIGRITAAGLWSASGYTGSPQATLDGTADPGTSVHPVFVQVDRAAGAFRVITDQEVIAPTYTAPSSGTDAYVSFGDGASVMKVRYGALWTGTAAQASIAQIRTLQTVLGWSPAF